MLGVPGQGQAGGVIAWLGPQQDGGDRGHRSCRSSRLPITCLMLPLLADASSSSLGRMEAAPGLSPPASLEREHPPHPSPPFSPVPPANPPFQQSWSLRARLPQLSTQGWMGQSSLSLSWSLLNWANLGSTRTPSAPILAVLSLLPHTSPPPCVQSHTDASPEQGGTRGSQPPLAPPKNGSTLGRQDPFGATWG